MSSKDPTVLILALFWQ